MEQQTETLVLKLQPEWPKEPSVLDLKKDFEECQSDHSAYIARLDQWETAFNIKPLPENKDKKAQSRISPKLVRKQYEWRCASLSEPFLATKELFKVKPVTHEDVERAKQNELILNYQFECKINKIPFIDKLIRKCAKEGTAVVRVGWLLEEVEVEKEIPQWSYVSAPEMAEDLNQYAEMMQSEPDTFANMVAPDMQESVRASMQMQQPIRAIQAGTRVVKEKLISQHLKYVTDVTCMLTLPVRVILIKLSLLFTALYLAWLTLKLMVDIKT